MIKTDKNKIKPGSKSHTRLYTVYTFNKHTCNHFIRSTNLFTTSYKFTQNQMKVTEGWVRNLLRLTFLKRYLKLVGLGMTTRFDGRLFQGWTTRQEKKCLEILDLAMGSWEQLFEGGGHVSWSLMTL